MTITPTRPAGRPMRLTTGPHEVRSPMLETLILAAALNGTPDAGHRPQRVVSAELTAAHSKKAHDMRGRMSSLYRGVYYQASQEPFRLCVAEREGEFHYDVQGGGGNSYYGTYQFSWRFRNGVPYMMAKESRRTKDGLVDEALALRAKPINQWSRYWQDRAFYTVLNFNGIGAGRHHWAGGRWSC